MNAFEEGLSCYFSLEQLAKIQQVKIGIAGAGGLGSNCAMLLVRSGFKRLLLVDFDEVSESNLNRQNFFLYQIGQKKVDVLTDNLLKINPDLQIAKYKEKINSSNISEVFEDCDIIIEAFDQVAAKMLVVEKFGQSDKVIVAASGIAGYGDSNRIITKKINQKFYVVGDFATDIAKIAPYAPCVMLAAAKQADIVLQIVLEE